MRSKQTGILVFFCFASLFLIWNTSCYADENNDPQDCKQYGKVANEVGWCLPIIELTGDLQRIFKIKECASISGLTCIITYNGGLPLPSEVFFVEYNNDGTVVGKRTRLIYPELKPGKSGRATFRIRSAASSKIVLTGEWKGPYKNPY